MNREQRRKAEREESKQRRKIWPSGVVDVPQGLGIKAGEKFTIRGVARRVDGSITLNCKPGNETVFVGNVL